jgi:type IV secretion system protein VirD4
MDEFANMPKIENFETIITVARSRRIYFTLILQSYAQLNIKYGQDIGATIKDNCNIHVFIASNDRTTLEEFSKRCGNITVETETTSVSKGKDEGSASKSIGVQQDTRPLIYPDELASLKPLSGECIVSILQQNPIKSMFTPSYKCSIYDMTPAPPNDALPNQLDKEAIYYDIRKRNEIVLKRQGGNMGGGKPAGGNPFDF